MKENKKLIHSIFKVLIISVALLFTLTVQAQAERYIEGLHYEVIDGGSNQSSADTIEVTEVFWYGCPHCYAFEPLLNNWLNDLDTKVRFERSPAVLSAASKQHALLYFTALSLGLFEDVHDDIFNSIGLPRVY